MKPSESRSSQSSQSVSKPTSSLEPDGVSRRKFISATAASAVATSIASSTVSAETPELPVVTYQFNGPDSDFHGHQWQSLNPGYWKIENGALRRRLHNYGDRARRTGFPFHAETNEFEFKTDYDPSLPTGILYATSWDLSDEYTLKVKFTFRKGRLELQEGDDPGWKMYQDGYGLMGVAIGGRSQLESYGKLTQAIRIGWCDDNKLKILGASQSKREAQGGNSEPRDQVLAEVAAMPLVEGDQCELVVQVREASGGTANQGRRAHITASLNSRDDHREVFFTVAMSRTSGYIGLAARGLIDFEVNEFMVDPELNRPLNVGLADCLVCYPLGDTLRQENDRWMVKFVGMFASDGRKAELRVADSPSPESGWKSVPVSGTASIVNNEWRRHTAVIDVALPANPANTTLYYTVWKDGVDVTADDRVGTAACGPGTGLVGDVPESGTYVGRLPQLIAPYKLCGLSCHAITSGLQQRRENGWKMSGKGDRWQFRDQPSEESYKHLEDYDFQVMVWEDDVWYMELVMYPPSTDDAYKIVHWSICGPTSRWQMMRHWNVINPGDHDYGMDDVKGPEQIAIRRKDGLGQDPNYMRRNFQIVHHLTTGSEKVDPQENPKKWRAWKMPNRDFTFVVLDSRLWRSSQDVDIWDDQGWGAFKSLYGRTDPTRSLLGEEQFGWLQELLATDSSPLIGLTGINGLHTIWAGTMYRDSGSTRHPKHFDQRDRVTADYAGWVKAGADRVIDLLGSRSGIVTVYGDVHNGCLLKNVEHRVIECSFGPIGRMGGRALIPGFGPEMKDVDDREVNIHALYHKQFSNPHQQPHSATDPFYWNFLEMEFDPRGADPQIELRIRNLVDAPVADPRGGGALLARKSETGRPSTCSLPLIQTLPNADVFLTETNGQPIRGIRSDGEGKVHLTGLPDLRPGTQIVVNAFDGAAAHSQVLKTGQLES